MASGKELQAIVSIAGKIDPSLQKAIASATKSTTGLSKGIEVAGAVAAASLAAMAAGAVAAGMALYNLAEEYEEAENAIRVGTGATGEALDDLYESMKEVYASVPTTMDDAATVISDYNTRLGLTGDVLEQLSSQTVEVADMLGEDLSGTIEESSQAFKQWSIDADDMADEMDYIYKVSQSTGMSFTDIMSDMQSSGAVLQDLGYNFDEAAAMIANLDKAGVNVSQVLKGMKKGLGNVAAEGGDAVAAMAEYTEQIANATTESEAITIATDVFGSATAVTMAQAIRSGAMNVEELTAALQENGETILGAAEDTYTLSDKMTMFKADLDNALEPLAMSVLDSLEESLPYIEDMLEDLTPQIEDFAEELGPSIQDFAENTLPVLIDKVEVLATGAGNVITFLIDNWQTISAIAGIVLAIAAAVGMLNGVMAVANGIAAVTGVAVGTIAAPLLAIIGIITAVIAIGVLLYQNWDLIVQKAGEVWQAIQSAFQGVAEFVTTCFEGIAAAVMTPINAVISVVNGIVSSINSLSITIPDWVPSIGGQTFGLSIPEIPMLATGGFTQGVSIAGEAGMEAVLSFDPAYRSENLSYWAKAGQMLGAGETLSELFESAGLSSSATEVNLGGVSFSPSITIQGNAEKQDVIAAIKAEEPEFFDMLRKFIATEGRDSYGSSY